jgi:hypothetical protein
MHTDAHQCSQKKVIIVVGYIPPTSSSCIIGDIKFEIRVICILRAKSKENNASKYEAIRYMRQKGSSSYWKQERKESITTQCLTGEDIYSEMNQSSDEMYYFYQCVPVYVRCDDCTNSDHWRTNFFDSMGGKPHARCQCRNFPLIPSNRNLKDRIKCNVKHYFRDDGSEHVKEQDCQ